MAARKAHKNIKLSKIVVEGKSSLSQIPLLKLIYASITINAIAFVLGLVLQRNLPPEIPLFYGLAEGQEQIVPSLWLLIPATVSSLILLINIFIIFFLKSEFLQKILVLTSLSVAALSLITSIKIVFLVGSF